MTNSDLQVWKGQKVRSGPKVSVIMPAYNVAQYIAEALDSVFDQTFTDFEVIVVNDGSPDTEDLERVLAPYLDRIVYAKQTNGGVSSARNTAVRLASAPYIAQLDPDDTWLPNYLEVQMGLIDSDPGLDVLYPNTVVFGESADSGLTGMQLSPSEGDVEFESLISQKCTVLACVVARRETLIRAGLFDESLRSSEDFDMWLRISKMGGRISYHRKVLARYRRRSDSLSANPIPMYESILQVLGKWEGARDLSARERQVLSEAISQFEADLDFSRGKKAFFAGDKALALALIKKANKYYRNKKLSLVIGLLTIAPETLLHIYRMRDRRFYGANTEF
jgi:glycosyltransferase involved in cell wall biosynthesis